MMMSILLCLHFEWLIISRHEGVNRYMHDHEDISTIQRERLAHIEFRAYFLGKVGRKDLCSRFGIAEAAATRDFTKYNELAPKNLIYDPRRREYIPSDSFKPLFKFSESRVLSTLAEGFGDCLKDMQLPAVSCETPTELNRPKLATLSVITRAIADNRVLEIHYRSLTSGETKREVVPFALVDNGLRWHIRAFDRRRDRFTDFVLTRITKPKILDSEAKDSEGKEYDEQWNKFVTIELIPHPSLNFKETIEKDYDMKNGVLVVKLRAAVAGYVLRRWNVDCSVDHSLLGNEYHLALKNRDILNGAVDTMVLAPGFRSQ